MNSMVTEARVAPTAKSPGSAAEAGRGHGPPLPSPLHPGGGTVSPGTPWERGGRSFVRSSVGIGLPPLPQSAPEVPTPTGTAGCGGWGPGGRGGGGGGGPPGGGGGGGAPGAGGGGGRGPATPGWWPAR